MNMKVLEVMTSPACACRPEDNLTAVAATMAEQGRGALAVLDRDGRPVGIVTGRDICRAVADPGRSPSSVLVREIMTPSPFTCAAITDVEEALRLMASCRVRRLLVVDRRSIVVGVVSLTDILEAAQEVIDFDIPLLRRLLASVARILRPHRGRRPGTPIPIGFGAGSPSGLQPQAVTEAGCFVS
jgi:CBS domain-containing protein